MLCICDYPPCTWLLFIESCWLILFSQLGQWAMINDLVILSCLFWTPIWYVVQHRLSHYVFNLDFWVNITLTHMTLWPSIIPFLIIFVRYMLLILRYLVYYDKNTFYVNFCKCQYVYWWLKLNECIDNVICGCNYIHDDEIDVMWF